MELIILIAVIIFSTTIQSLFGVGVLVIGTPLLLVLQYPFDQALAILLPVSLASSILQTFDGRKTISRETRNILIGLIPTVLLGTFLLTRYSVSFDVRPYVAAILFIVAVARFSRRCRSILEFVFSKVFIGSLFLVGILHGFTNMGGGFLTMVIGSRFNDKMTIRTHVSISYIFLIICQLTVLLYTATIEINWPQTALLATLACLHFWFIGRKLFNAISNALFTHLLSGLLLVMAVILAWQSRGA